MQGWFKDQSAGVILLNFWIFFLGSQTENLEVYKHTLQKSCFWNKKQMWLNNQSGYFFLLKGFFFVTLGL